jgi:hypothetical protein
MSLEIDRNRLKVPHKGRLGRVACVGLPGLTLEVAHVECRKG